MFKLFPLITFLLSFSVLANEDGAEVLISTLPEDMVATVFPGSDLEMPITGQFDLAIEMPKELQSRPPRSIEDAFEQMRRILPHWYLSALLRSEGDYECTVRVNDASFSVLIGNWLWVQWGMGGDESVLRQVFSDMGVHSSGLVRQALNSGLCIDLKRGRKAALEEILTYSVDAH